MNHQTIVATRYIDNQLIVLAECFQHDHGKNEWFKVNDVQTWADWSEDWFNYVNGDIAEYGSEMYKRLSNVVILPLHTAPSKPILDSGQVEWARVGEAIRSHFGK